MPVSVLSTREDRHNLVIFAQASDPGCSECRRLAVAMMVIAMKIPIATPVIMCEISVVVSAVMVVYSFRTSPKKAQRTGRNDNGPEK